MTVSQLYSLRGLINTHDNTVAAAVVAAAISLQYFAILGAVSPITSNYYDQAAATAAETNPVAAVSAVLQQQASSTLSISPNFTTINAFEQREF
ncbi:hypothetical protein HK100_007363 [Physocladia obscura]|uniref:Uncharacterized protein n=1 Tax=Physocladia obscura TaxID=109957 RepID=A0AAD5XC55_9FUNG|nr:hypothetical protein HK100_007363 [Physocladia obscura]